MKMTYMKWLANMSEGKPNTYINKEEQCPFLRQGDVAKRRTHY